MISRLDELVATAHREQLIRDASVRRRAAATEGRAARRGLAGGARPPLRRLADLWAPVALRCLAVTPVVASMPTGSLGRHRVSGS